MGPGVLRFGLSSVPECRVHVSEVHVGGIVVMFSG